MAPPFQLRNRESSSMSLRLLAKTSTLAASGALPSWAQLSGNAALILARIRLLTKQQYKLVHKWGDILIFKYFA
jgi:hypothetical protein